MNCPHFGICGGCSYACSYEEQLAAKELEMKKLFTPLLGEEFFSGEAYDGIFPSPLTEGYRNKMEYSFGNERKDGPLCLGMHKKGRFYDVMSVPGCRIVHPDFNALAAAVEAYFREKEIPFYHKMSHTGALRHLVLRRSETTGELLVNLVTTGEYRPDEEFLNMVRAVPTEGRLAGILHTENNSLSDAVIAEKVTLLYGKEFLRETVLGLDFKISPFSFFQTNTKGAEVLYEKARSYIGEIAGSTVYDLYSGTGTIAQALSPAAGRVIGVELVAEAVDAARENAKQNGLENCEFLAGDVLKCLDEIAEPADFMVLDPPRDGVNPKALSKIMRSEPKRLVYISCKPKSLARDIPALRLGGYEVSRFAIVDMFPHTSNCEVVSLLSRTEGTKREA